MSMSMGPAGAPNQQEVLEALNKYDIENKKEAEKKKEQKEFNEFLNAVQDIKASTEIMILINQYQEARMEALLTADMDEKRIYEEKAQNFVKNIEAYYAGNKQEVQQVLAQEEKKTPQEKVKALDLALGEIATKKEGILSKWKSIEDKIIWLGRTWKEAVLGQAAHYTSKNEDHVQKFTDKNIDILVKQGAQLSDIEKTQLKSSGAPALQVFKEALELLQLNDALNPMSSVMLEVLYVGLITNTTRAANRVIDELNKARLASNPPITPPIPPLKLDLREGLKFAKETAKGDRNQIAANIQNHIMLQALERQEQAINQTKAEIIAQYTAAPMPAANIVHCEVKATSPSVYDSDLGSRFALQPHSSNNFSILKKACEAINQQTKGEKLIIHKQQGRNIEFEFNNQRFSYDSGSGQFSADNLRPETFQMMMKLYNQVYKGSDTQIKCDDQVSKRLCESGVTEFNNTAQNKITNPRVVIASAGKIPASTEKTAAKEKPEAEVKQDVTSSRKM